MKASNKWKGATAILLSAVMTATAIPAWASAEVVEEIDDWGGGIFR